MATVEMLRPYIEKQFTEILGVEKLFVASNGDIPVSSGSSVTYGRLVEGPTGPLLRMTSPVLRKVESSPALMERLNTMNAGSYYVKFFHTEGNIYCEMDLYADNIQGEEIRNALDAITYQADRYDDELQKEFGGERMIEPQPEQAEGAAADDAEGTPGTDKAGYL